MFTSLHPKSQICFRNVKLIPTRTARGKTDRGLRFCTRALGARNLQRSCIPELTMRVACSGELAPARAEVETGQPHSIAVVVDAEVSEGLSLSA